MYISGLIYLHIFLMKIYFCMQMREYPFWIERLAFFLVSVSTNSHWQRYSYWERCIGVGLFVFTNAVYTYMMIFMDFKDFGSSCWSLFGSSNNNPTVSLLSWSFLLTWLLVCVSFVKFSIFCKFVWEPCFEKFDIRL